MDSEILEQLKNIGQQLEKITKLLEEKKSFAPKRDFFPGKKVSATKNPSQEAAAEILTVKRVSTNRVLTPTVNPE